MSGTPRLDALMDEVDADFMAATEAEADNAPPSRLDALLDEIASEPSAPPAPSFLGYKPPAEDVGSAPPGQTDDDDTRPGGHGEPVAPAQQTRGGKPVAPSLARGTVAPRGSYVPEGGHVTMGEWLQDAGKTAEDLGHGAAKGATLGWGDEIASSDLPAFDDGTGIPRTYAEGSAQESMQAGMRANDDQAQARSPVAFGIGEAGGSAVTTAPLMALAAPAGAASVATGGLARTVAPSLLRRVATNAVTGGVTTAATAAGYADDGDRLEAAKHGATVGAGLAGGLTALPAVGAWLRGTPSAVKRKVGEVAQAHADKAGGKLALQLGGSAEAKAATQLASPEGVLAPGVPGPQPAGYAAREAAAAGASRDTAVQHGDEIAARVSKIADTGDLVKWEEDIAAKRPVLRQMMEEGKVDPAKVVAAADAAYNNARAEFDQIVEDVGSGPGAATLRRLKRETFDQFEKTAEKRGTAAYDAYEASGDAAGSAYDYATDKLMQVDGLKRHVQKVIANGGPAIAEFDQPLRDKIESPLRELLENAEMVGEGPAAFQTIRNRGWTDALLLKQGNGKRDFPFLTTKEGVRSADRFLPKRSADRVGVQSVVDNAADPVQVQNVNQLVDWADREAKLLEALTKHRGADDALKARAAQARQLANEIKEQIAARRAQGGAAQSLQDVASAPTTEDASLGGPAHWLARHTPYVGKAVEAADNLLPTTATRAKALQQAEQVLRNNPSPSDAKAAQAVIDGMRAEDTKLQGLRDLRLVPKPEAGPVAEGAGRALGSPAAQLPTANEMGRRGGRAAAQEPMEEPYEELPPDDGGWAEEEDGGVSSWLGGLGASKASAQDKPQAVSMPAGPSEQDVQTLATTQPQKLGKHGPELGAAFQKSPEHGAAEFSRLMETDPEFQRLMREVSERSKKESVTR